MRFVVGMVAENQHNIFDRFVKVEDEQKQYFRGTRIGLFLCQKIIQKLNGRIWVESVYGEGATFYFTIDE
ncbi:sensor histidine kinase [Sunxiuqinia indica]|uniref:sensor histidine kinase n=1 Tax=Sunxiuqinia indica TaxID=2692584 RepID=UPI00135BC73F|nr:ATP-binding protein [Sunxiuqinia indica]